MTITDVRHLYTQMPKLRTPHIGAILHHSARRIVHNATLEQEQARLDSINTYHESRGFSMGIGYHWVAFPTGHLYRVGDSNTQRAHVKDKNHLYTGVCIIGDYSNGTPTEAAQDAVREALDFSGLDLIGGHREVQPGKGICPGFWDYDRLNYPKAPELTMLEKVWSGIHAARSFKNHYITPSHQDARMRYYELKMPK